jgi:hypothetical protein
VTSEGKKTPETGEPLAVVRRVPDEATATLLCDLLRDNGIEATAVSSQMPWFGTIETARRGYWGAVEVLKRDLERAKELISDFYSATPDMDEWGDADREDGW